MQRVQSFAGQRSKETKNLQYLSVCKVLKRSTVEYVFTILSTEMYVVWSVVSVELKGVLPRFLPGVYYKAKIPLSPFD